VERTGRVKNITKLGESALARQRCMFMCPSKLLRTTFSHTPNKTLETSARTKRNTNSFIHRLNNPKGFQEIDVEIHDQKFQGHGLTKGFNSTTRNQIEYHHKWLDCMDDFAEFLQKVKVPRQLHEDVKVALIDDGVDISEPSLYGRILGGRDFCQRDGNQELSEPYYVSSGGHGTEMASLICRVCPKVQLYIVKLASYEGENLARQITANSAAKVCLQFPFFFSNETKVS
jgi:hypothetical protein